MRAATRSIRPYRSGWDFAVTLGLGPPRGIRMRIAIARNSKPTAVVTA
jgi:hypothetical protein